MSGQLNLFGLPAAPPPQPAAVSAELSAIGQHLPPLLRFGTSSWAYPGWKGLVYRDAEDERSLAREGLRAYSQHPLLRAVGVDRTHYAPLPADEFATLAAQVPDAFRFLVKAHDHLTLARFPNHARYGAQAGRINPRFLDAAYATDAVVRPFVEGLGRKAGPLLFQFAPQDLADLGGAVGFAERLYRFLSALPRGPCYAVEVRNTALLTPVYADALHAVRACPCLLAWPGMPDLAAQAHAVRVEQAPALVLRWMLHQGHTYEQVGRDWAPFDQIHDEDPDVRDVVARLSLAAIRRGRPALVIINNNAEGCAPRSIARLARDMVGAL